MITKISPVLPGEIFQFVEKGIRFADAIKEWGPLSQAPKPAELLNAGGVSPVATGDEGSALDPRAF